MFCPVSLFIFDHCYLISSDLNERTAIHQGIFVWGFERDSSLYGRFSCEAELILASGCLGNFAETRDSSEEVSDETSGEITRGEN